MRRAPTKAASRASPGLVGTARVTDQESLALDSRPAAQGHANCCLGLKASIVPVDKFRATDQSTRARGAGVTCRSTKPRSVVDLEVTFRRGPPRRDARRVSCLQEPRLEPKEPIE